MSRRLLPLLVLVFAVALPAFPARAVSPPLIVKDPAGDSLDARASMDILSTTFEVKKVKASDPKPSLIITMKLGAQPEQQLVSYDVWATIPECGEFNATYAPGTILTKSPAHGNPPPSSVFICNGSADPSGSLDLHHPKFAIGKDNTLTWTIALDYFSKRARAGAKLTEIHADTQLAEPLTGIIGNAALGVPTDALATDKEFTFA